MIDVPHPDEYGTCCYCRSPFVPKAGEGVCANCMSGADDLELDDDSDLDAEDFDGGDSIERALDQCYQTGDGGCMMAGTEFCDWECPFNRI